MLDPLRRVYIISKRRALSGRDVEIRTLTDLDLLFINYIYTDAGEIRDFDSWAAIIRAMLPELESDSGWEKKEVAPPIQSTPATNQNAVAVKPTKLLHNLAMGVRGIIPSAQVEATPEQAREFLAGTKN